MDFLLYIIVIDLNSHTWLLVTVLASSALQFSLKFGKMKAYQLDSKLKLERRQNYLPSAILAQ